MAEWTSNAVQIVNPGETIVFTENPVPCTKGLVRHRDGAGNFLLAGYVPCGCSQSANYNCEFGANISVPEGGTAEAISVAIMIDGATVPSSTMEVTPAAVNEYFNVSREMSVQIWRGCCESVSVRNTSDQPIQVRNASISFSRPDIR